MTVCIIAGSRTAQWVDVQTAMRTCPWSRSITEVVSGMEPNGADWWGMMWAGRQGVPVVPFYPDWTTYGLAAGGIRNQAMAEYAGQYKGRLVLVWTGDPRTSKGSANMLRQALKHKLEIHEHIIRR